MNSTYLEEITRIPFEATTISGTGLLGQLNRVTGHVLYIMGRLLDPASRRPTENQILEEVSSIREHMVSFVIPDYLSKRSVEYLEYLVNSLTRLESEFAGWDEETRVSNLKILCNRIAFISSMLDRDALGISSDPGRSL